MLNANLFCSTRFFGALLLFLTVNSYGQLTVQPAQTAPATFSTFGNTSGNTSTLATTAPSTLAPTAAPGPGTVSLYFDCYLPQANVACFDLINNWASSNPLFSQTQAESDAQVALTLRSRATPNATLYIVDIHANGLQITTVHAEISIDQSISSQGVLSQLVGDLSRLTLAYLRVISRSYEVGTYTVTLGSPDGVAGPQQNLSRWAFSPSISGSIHSGASTNVSLSGDVDVNYSDPRWRFLTNAAVSYSYLRASNGGRVDSGEVFSFSGRTIFVRSIPGAGSHWSFALVAGGRHAPQINYDSQVNVNAGVEWNLVPFIENNDSSLVIRYIIGPEYNSFISPNTSGQTGATFVNHALAVYFNWHLRHPHMDISASASAGSNIANWDFFQVGVGAQVRFFITNTLL